MPTTITFRGKNATGFVILYPERLFGAGGVVTDWNRRKAVELQGNLLHYAPWRTGRLRRSIKTVEHRRGPLSRTINVRIGVKYAAYTDQGTRPIITAGGRLMPVGRSQGASGKIPIVSVRRNSDGTIYTRTRTGYTYRRQVRGQKGTHWVASAIRDIPEFSRYRD